MSGTHAFLPPSGADAWSRCAAWPSMNLRYPQSDTPATIEGNTAHWVAAELHAGRSPAEGTLAPTGYPVTGEMLRYGLEYAQLLFDLAPPAQWYIEHRVTMHESIHPQNDGTPDAFAWASARHLIVADYKFGHDSVPADTLQVVNYVRGVLDACGIPYEREPDIAVTTVIFQPRDYTPAGSVKRIDYPSAAALRPQWDRLVLAAHRATVPTPTATVGEQCRYCPGSHACPALQRAGYDVMTWTAKHDPHDLDRFQLGDELRRAETALAVLTARVKGLQDDAVSRITRGERDFGYTLDPSEGRKQWTVPIDRLASVGKFMGLDLLKPQEAITPNQAIERGMPASIVTQFSASKRGGDKLVRTENSRIARAFKKE